MALFHSSVIVTGAATDSRTRDQLSFAVTFRPQALTAYLRFREQGTINIANARLIHLGNNSGTLTRIQIQSTGTFYTFVHANESGSRQVTLAAAPVYGDMVEIRAVVNSNGSILLGQSINGAAETVTTTSGTLVFGPVWATAALWVNSISTAGVGFNAFRNIEIVAGVRTMQQMRVVAGTD